MGVFDYVRCKYPLPIPETQEVEYQTKDTEMQWLEQYEIREDGTLWVLEKEREWRADENSVMGGFFDTISQAWCEDKMTGELVLSGSYGPLLPSGIGCMWITYSVYFKDGKLQQINVIEHKDSRLPDSGGNVK